MPFDPMELNIFFGIIGLAFASANTYLGLHYFVLRKYEQPDPLLKRFHHLFGTIGYVFFYLISILCIITFSDSWSLGIPPKNLNVFSSYFIHAFVGFIAFSLFSFKIFYAYYDPVYVRKKAKQFGVFAVLAWLLVWSTSVWDYYWHAIPDLGMIPFYLDIIYFEDMVIVSALITFLIPYFIGAFLYLIIYYKLSKNKQLEKRD